MKPSITRIHQPVEELSFVIDPPPHIKSDVSVLKDDVQFLTSKSFEDRYAPAHIALFRYDDKQHFDDILREVESKAAKFDPFNIFLKGLKYHWMYSNRSIYLDILNKPDVREIFGKLVKENSRYSPFISVAKGLDHEGFLKAWLHLQDLQYAQDFLCDRITVLARKENQWLRYKEFMFAGG
ncbi:MAG TPA: 2'-5' RNA ligase family protein [Chryseolinea sp.]